MFLYRNIIDSSLGVLAQSLKEFEANAADRQTKTGQHRNSQFITLNEFHSFNYNKPRN